MTVTLRSGARTDVGRAREMNEDSMLAEGHVFAVADGLGGHRGGEVASAIAIDTLRPLADREPSQAAADLADTVREANRIVLDRSRDDAALSGMGTTVTAVVIDGARAHIVHVGDSRAYLIRDGAIEQLTQDHTMVARLVRDGRLTPEEAERHPQRSMLTRALGSEQRVDVDEFDVPLGGGDRLLLCSDGLTNMLTDSEIAHIIREGKSADEVCTALVDAANTAGGIDNITAVLIEVDGDIGPAPVLPPRPSSTTGGRPMKRALVWTTLLIVALVGAVVTLRMWADDSWYVGDAQGEVAIYNGLPFDVPGLGLQRVDQQTGIAVADLPSFLQREVDEGIAAESAADARRIITEQIVPHVALPTPSPTASPGPTVSPTRTTTGTPTP